MAPYITEEAKKNLQGGIRKMETSMTPAAQVRRSFQLGRPKRSPDRDEPLHPAVVWQRANAALADFRGRMVAAGLDSGDAVAYIVYVGLPDIDEPKKLAIDGTEGEDTTPEDHRRTAFEALSAPDTLALGLVFVQMDRKAGEHGQRAVFPYQFMGLSLRAQAVLKRAALEILAALNMQNRAS